MAAYVRWCVVGISPVHCFSDPAFAKKYARAVRSGLYSFPPKGKKRFNKRKVRVERREYSAITGRFEVSR